MAKRIISVILAVVILLTASGCATFFEKEYVSEEPHDLNSVPVSEAVGTIEVSNYTELKEAIMTFISAVLTKGKVKFSAYQGDPTEDISTACMEIVNDTPIGAYAIYYIDYTVFQIVSYYEAEVSITYKKNAEQMVAIVEVDGVNALKAQLIIAARRFRRELVIRTDNPDMDENTVEDALDEVYYASPGSLYAVPESSTSIYPEHGKGERIFEITLDYVMSEIVMKNRLKEISDYVDGIMTGTRYMSEDTGLEYIARSLSSSTKYVAKQETDDAQERWNEEDTSYGALIGKKASGEGFAVAMKLICNKMGIRCVVVRGRLNNISHSWNIVELEDGYYYHLDVSMLKRWDVNPFKTDEEMGDRYWWYAGDYPECTGSSETVGEPENPQTAENRAT